MLDPTLRQQVGAVLPHLRTHRGLLSHDLAHRLEIILAADPSQVHETIHSHLMLADLDWLQSRINRIEALAKVGDSELATVFGALLTEVKRAQQLVEQLRALDQAVNLQTPVGR